MSISRVKIDPDVKVLSKVTTYKIEFTFDFNNNSAFYTFKMGIVCKNDYNYRRKEDNITFQSLCIEAYEIENWDDVHTFLHEIIDNIMSENEKEDNRNLIVEHIIKRCEHVMVLNDVKYFDL